MYVMSISNRGALPIKESNSKQPHQKHPLPNPKNLGGGNLKICKEFFWRGASWADLPARRRGLYFSAVLLKMGSSPAVKLRQTKQRPDGLFFVWRTERDSNPRRLAPYRFSRAASSTTPAPLQVIVCTK